MNNPATVTLSVVVPLFNEAAGLSAFHSALIETLGRGKYAYEVIYCDDGSSDDTGPTLQELAKDNSQIRILSLSRNFGKENALAAGIAAARGKAIVMIDGDGQHPVNLIPEFFEAWKTGAKVVVGVRTANAREGAVKRQGSNLFYNTFNKLSHTDLIPGSSDFRLIDRSVQQAFLRLPETDRITRGLIDWLGFERTYIQFSAKPRLEGSAGYSHRKLVTLAANSFVSLTSVPLYLFGYLGMFITTAALILGLSVGIEQILLGDPWQWKFTGTAMLSIFLMFLIGLVLLSQGVLALYISHINNQSKRRPLYIIDYDKSVGIEAGEQPHGA